MYWGDSLARPGESDAAMLPFAGRRIVVDVAGAATGGAARFRGELLGYLDRHPTSYVEVIGVGLEVSPRWLIQREFAGGSRIRIATNNVGFVGGTRRIVLLRNALHFPEPGEADRATRLRVRMRAQAAVVHRAALRAHIIVVPTTDMASRVGTWLPTTKARIQVRPHPLTFRQSAGGSAVNVQEPFILCPALPAAHKDTAEHVRWLLRILSQAGLPERVAVTAAVADLPADLRSQWRLLPVGPQPVWAMAEWYTRARAVYYPALTESFGYPIAEARVIGRHVIAIDMPRNHEVGGHALCGFATGDDDSLSRAVHLALASNPQPDLMPFDADDYFAWLLELAYR